MKVKTWVPLVLAVILGLIAAKMTRDSMARGRAPGPQINLVAMVTAAQDIEPGQKLTADMLSTGKVLAGSVPVGAFQSPADVADRVAMTRFVKDQPVLENMLAPQGAAAGMQALIPPGMRAITVEVNEFSGLAGLLTPGCRVDIISVVRSGDEGAQQSMARTIVQNVEVRAVGRSISATPAAPAADGTAAPLATSVTLLVTPIQAEAMQLAGTGGRPWLVLRNARDEAPFETTGTSLADLRGEARKAPLPEAEPQPDPEPVAVVPPPTDDVDVFEETPSEPLPPPAPRTRAVTFIRATKEETVQVDLPEQPETITSTNDPNDPTGGK